MNVCRRVELKISSRCLVTCVRLLVVLLDDADDDAVRRRSSGRSTLCRSNTRCDLPSWKKHLAQVRWHSGSILRFCPCGRFPDHHSLCCNWQDADAIEAHTRALQQLCALRIFVRQATCSRMRSRSTSCDVVPFETILCTPGGR